MSTISTSYYINYLKKNSTNPSRAHWQNQPKMTKSRPLEFQIESSWTPHSGLSEQMKLNANFILVDLANFWSTRKKGAWKFAEQTISNHYTSLQDLLENMKTDRRIWLQNIGRTSNLNSGLLQINNDYRQQVNWSESILKWCHTFVCELTKNNIFQIMLHVNQLINSDPWNINWWFIFIAQIMKPHKSGTLKNLFKI